MAVEGGREFNTLLQKVYGHRLVHTSPLDDPINIFDTTLDSTLCNRLTIGFQGLELAAEKKTKAQQMNDREEYTVVPSMWQVLKRKIIKRHFANDDDTRMRAVMDLEGYIHPALSKGGQLLEFCVRRLEFATEIALDRRVNDLYRRKQTDLNELASIAILIFRFTCILSRTSRSHCETLRNSDIDCNLAVREAQITWHKVKAIANRMEYADEDFTDFNNKCVSPDPDR